MDPTRIIRDSLPTTFKKVATFLSYLAGVALFVRIEREYLPADLAVSGWELGALYAANALLLALIFVAVLSLVALGSVYAKLPDDADPIKTLNELDGRLFGIVRTKHTTHTVVRSDFSAEVRHWTTFRATADRFDCTEHRSYSSTTDRQAVEVSADTLGGDVEIKPKIKSVSGRECFIVLHFLPPFWKGKEVSYSYSQIFPPGSFFKNTAELPADLKSDHCVDIIQYPTEHLVSTIEFPSGFEPTDMDADVWMGDTKVQHHAEFLRVHNQSCFRADRTADRRVILKIEVKYPLRGLHYALKWAPPD